jgi:hypothetical protein
VAIPTEQSIGYKNQLRSNGLFEAKKSVSVKKASRIKLTGSKGNQYLIFKFVLRLVINCTVP